jgi:hypothetical protein
MYRFSSGFSHASAPVVWTVAVSAAVSAARQNAPLLDVRWNFIEFFIEFLPRRLTLLSMAAMSDPPCVQAKSHAPPDARNGAVAACL